MHPDPLTTGHARSFTDVPALAERAADLLRTPHALLQLTPPEAAWVVEQMLLLSFPPGATLFREGEAAADHMLLLLDGEVEVDTAADGPTGPVAISVVGPGSVLGEMAVLDGAPRSASCVAMTPVQAAGLSRRGLERLIDTQPRAAAKLLLSLGTRTAERLRALGEQLQLYARLVDAKQAELDRLRAAHQP
ncbi:MAG TPA: cyclic nucleotide-binding domain-containing protein [Methylibium sp.]|nr:cyclic nucleotide-binding domain-containing protein [Methylibium sp.]